MLNNYEDTYTNYYEDAADDVYAYNESADSFQMNAVIAKKNEAELVSLMILGFFIIFNTLLYKSVTKIISTQRERLVKYQLISEYYINTYGRPLTCPIQPSEHLDDPDVILNHIIKTEAKESNPVIVKWMSHHEVPCGKAAAAAAAAEDKTEYKTDDNKRILRSQKKSLDINGNGWKLD